MSTPLHANPASPEERDPRGPQEGREYEFTLYVEGVDVNDPDNAEALFEATNSDVSPGFQHGEHQLSFTRTAPSFPDAVREAMEQVEGALPALRVVRIEPEDLVTAGDIANRTGRSRQSISLLIKGWRGPGNFPRPVGGVTTASRFWSWSEVLAWFADYTGEMSTEDIFIAEFTAMLNARLQERKHRRRLEEMAANHKLDANTRDMALATCAKIGAA